MSKELFRHFLEMHEFWKRPLQPPFPRSLTSLISYQDEREHLNEPNATYLAN